MKNIILVFIMFFMVSPLIFQDLSPGTVNYPSYMAFLTLLIIMFLYTMINPRFKSLSRITLIDLIPLSILFIWFYGVVVGIVSGNKPSFIFRNFAGMLLYIIYFIMIWHNVSRKKLLVTIYLAGAIYVIFSMTILNKFLLNQGQFVTIFGFNRVYFNMGTIVMFPLLLFSTIVLIYKKKDVLNGFQSSPFKNIIFSKALAIILFILVFVGAIILPYSKGNILAFNFFMILSLLVVLFSNKSSIIKKIIISIFFFSISIFLLDNFITNQFLFTIFSENMGGNSERYEQIPMLINDFSLIGNGLGATIKGYSRSDRWGYGFETTYFNLIHKFGVLSLILFIGYFISFIIPIKRIINKKELVISSAALGMLAFVFPAIGNPLLYAPVACILHCSSLYLMRSSSQ